VNIRPLARHRPIVPPGLIISARWWAGIFRKKARQKAPRHQCNGQPLAPGERTHTGKVYRTNNGQAFIYADKGPPEDTELAASRFSSGLSGRVVAAGPSGRIGRASDGAAVAMICRFPRYEAPLRNATVAKLRFASGNDRDDFISRPRQDAKQSFARPGVTKRSFVTRGSSRGERKRSVLRPGGPSNAACAG